MTSSADFPNLPSVWLHELTWEEVASYLRRRDTIIVPFGTTEQHGPAGSLGLDGYVAIGLAEDAAKKAGVLSAPPVWYGPHRPGVHPAVRADRSYRSREH